MKTTCRILDAEGKIMHTGTEQGSWFTLEDAKNLVNRENGEMIYAYSEDCMSKLWEVL